MSSNLLLLAQDESVAVAVEAQQYFFGLEESYQRFTILIVLIGCVTLVTGILIGVIGSVWSSVRQKEIESDLKQDMLERGMSAAEIEQVVKAQPKEGLDHWMEVWAKKKRS